MLGGGRHFSPDLVNIEWSYEKHGTTILCEQEVNEMIEMAYSKDEPTVHVCLQGEVFVVDLMTKTGRGQHTGEHIILNRKWLGSSADQLGGFLFPENWTPMPHPNTTVHTVQLSTDSPEYIEVVNKFQATVSAVNVQKIERIQNPHLYQTYMLKKRKMDQDNGGVENERQLFHGTRRENISHINMQGFNRSFSRYAAAYGHGVYFAKDSSYSVRYAGHPGGNRYMYLARVLVGQYCTGYFTMVVPPPKDPSRPEVLYDSVVDQCENPNVFVVFLDNQCYPEYLITFQ